MKLFPILCLTVLMMSGYVMNSCGKHKQHHTSGNPDKPTEEKPKADKPNGEKPTERKPGWTKEAIETLIGCQPNPGPICDCLIPQVTQKYTPEQVKQNSALVAQDILSISNSCDSSTHPQVASSEQPQGGSTDNSPHDD